MKLNRKTIIMTVTTFTDNFATLIDSSAEDFKSILTTVAGGFEKDFDIDNAVEDYVEELNKTVNPLGVDVTNSGVSYCEYGDELDIKAVHDAATAVNVYDVLNRNDRTR